MDRLQLERIILVKLDQFVPGRAFLELKQILVEARDDGGYRLLLTSLSDMIEDLFCDLRAGEHLESTLKRSVIGQKIKICAELHALVEVYLSSEQSAAKAS